MSMLVAQNIELFTLALSGITIILIPEKGPKYRTVRLNTGHLATLNIKYINRPPLLDDLDPPLTSIRANDFAYRPAGSRDFSGSVPLSADEVCGTHQLMERQRSYRKEITRGLGL